MNLQQSTTKIIAIIQRDFTGMQFNPLKNVKQYEANMLQDP